MCRDEPQLARPANSVSTTMTAMYPFMEPGHVPGLKLSDPAYSQQSYHLPHPQPQHGVPRAEMPLDPANHQARDGPALSCPDVAPADLSLPRYILTYKMVL